MRQKNQLHLPLVKFSSIQKHVTYSLQKIFNRSPLNTSKLHRDSISFQYALKKFIVKNDFYTTDEFLSINCEVN